jgi:spore coat polysaccharide biosynthesis predicted glycosyltransferase SpsG
MFGGSDPANLTSAALEQLLLLDQTLKLDVVLGARFSHDEDMLRVLQRHEGIRENVKVYRDIPNVAELMYRADLVLASPGLSAFEALRVGTPVIVVPHDTLQRDTYEGFIRMLERDELWKLGDMIDRGDYTYPRDQQIARMEIGEGVGELKEEIMRLPIRQER